MKRIAWVWVLVALSASLAEAAAFGIVRGVVRDSAGQVLVGAQATLRGTTSSWTKTATTDQEGHFTIEVVPVGVYSVSVSYAGFATSTTRIEVTSGRVADLTIGLHVANLTQQVEVAATPVVDTTSSSIHALVTREDIAHTPGADDPNSLAMITSAVAGATLVHDQLHVRGGHQVSWLLDGVPIPNTNIATNVGPQINPADIDVLEIQRGGYPADYGDRTYGVFDVVPRTGFERANDADVTASYGSFGSTADRASFGGHTTSFAYYGSVSGNRSTLGLMPPSADIEHDGTTGTGGFGSLVFGLTPHDQVRFVTTLRQDTYDIPTSADDRAAGIADLDHEADAAVVVSWVHVFNDHTSLSVSPFFHQNRANFDGGPTDTPVIPTDHRTSRYAGAQSELTVVSALQNIRIGLEAFHQSDATTFGATGEDPTTTFLDQTRVTGGLAAFFVEDQMTVVPHMTLSAGLRLTAFDGSIHERAASPRLGLTVTLPHQAVVRASYGLYYQPPPLDTVSGSLDAFTEAQGFAFLPLHGERDRQFETSIAVPVHGWTTDATVFETDARNFFDHDAVGNSNIFLPLTIDRARIRGLELTATSPLRKPLRLRVVYSRQYAQGRGAVTGGLTDFEPPDEGYFYLDHDQRDTVATTVSADLPGRAWLSSTINVGSGFLDGDGPGHLPADYTADIAVGRPFGTHWTAKATVLNLTNQQYFVDLSNTFGGTHFSYPRRAMLQLTYKFKY
jgi:outer membrane cobalamin receptor